MSNGPGTYYINKYGERVFKPLQYCKNCLKKGIKTEISYNNKLQLCKDCRIRKCPNPMNNPCCKKTFVIAQYGDRLCQSCRNKKNSIKLDGNYIYV